MKHPPTRTYLLNSHAQALKWSEWKKLGGCSLSHYASEIVLRKLGPLVFNAKSAFSLGEIQDACVVAGREMASFAMNHLNKGSWVELE